MAIKIPTRATQDIGLTTQTAGVKADLTRSSPEMAALGNIGDAIGESAGYMAQYARIEKAQIIDDEITAARIADGKAYSEFTEARKNDINYMADEDEYKKWYQKHRSDILGTFTDETARKKFDSYLQFKDIERSVSVRKTKCQRHLKDIIDRLPDRLDGLIATDDIDFAYGYLENLKDRGFLDGAQKNRWENYIEKSIEGQEKLKAEQLLLQARDEALQLPTEQEAVTYINNLTGQLSKEQRQDLENQVRDKFAFEKQAEKEAKEQLEVDQNNTTRDFILRHAESRDVIPSQLNDAFRAGQITQKQYDDLTKRITAPEPITNRILEAELYTKSLDIWRGTTSKAEFDRELNKNSKNLDDSTYRSLAKSAADTLKSSQAEALKRADIEASRLIVDHVDEDAFSKFIRESMKGLDPDAADLFKNEANEVRELQFWSLSRYNAELRDWITENPDKLGKDFFQFSEALKHQYWNMSREDIETKRLEYEKKLVRKKTNRDKGPVELQPQKTLTATNSSTGDKAISYDGGQTWQPIQ